MKLSCQSKLPPTPQPFGMRDPFSELIADEALLPLATPVGRQEATLFLNQKCGRLFVSGNT
ncbi:hypothetical protein ACVWZF_001654 [Thermostichus sp. OS-CIW-30]